MSFSRRIAVWSLVLGILFAGSALWAQEGADEAADPSAPAEARDEPKKWPFALYVGASAGVVTADPIDTSIQTLVTHRATSILDLEDALFTRASVGWKLPNGKGDFRVNVQNFKEDGYVFNSQGFEASIDPGLGINSPVQDNLLWWDVTAIDGQLTATQTPPQWSVAADANSDGQVQMEEVSYDPGLASTTSRTISDDFENRTQHVDAVYGREFGRRRVSSRWWAGLRYFLYEGNTPAGAWLTVFPDGSGFTDGTLNRLLNFTQETEGFGPTGSLELDFNFFNKRLQLYFQGTAAFTVLSLDMDSGLFVTLVRVGGDILPVEGRLTEGRNKSTWQNAAEAGARVHLANGVSFDLSYSVTGYLDVMLTPTELRIPTNSSEAPQGSSALFNTQDLVFDGWRAGFSFQF